MNAREQIEAIRLTVPKFTRSAVYEGEAVLASDPVDGECKVLKLHDIANVLIETLFITGESLIALEERIETMQAEIDGLKPKPLECMGCYVASPATENVTPWVKTTPNP